MKKFDDILYTLLCWACGLLMFAMVSVIFSQVIARYVFAQSLTWSEEVGRYIFVWITFLGMAAAFRLGVHVSLDLLVRCLRGYPRKALEIINSALVTVLSSAILMGGIKLFLLGMRQKSPALKLPMYWVYTVIPLTGAILLYFSLRVLWTHIAAKKEG